MLLLTDYPDLSVLAAAERKGWEVRPIHMLYWHNLPDNDDENSQGKALVAWIASLPTGAIACFNREDPTLIAAMDGDGAAIAEYSKAIELSRWTRPDVWAAYYAPGTANMQFWTEAGYIKTWHSATPAEAEYESRRWSRCLPLLLSQRIAFPSVYDRYQSGPYAEAVETARNENSVKLCAGEVDCIPFVCHHRCGDWMQPKVTFKEWVATQFQPAIRGLARGVAWWTAGMQLKLPAARLRDDMLAYAEAIPEAYL